MKKFLKIFIPLIIILLSMFSCEELINPQLKVLYITSDGTAAPKVEIGGIVFDSLATGVESSYQTFEPGDYSVFINDTDHGLITLTQFAKFLLIVKGTGGVTPSYSYELYSEE
jgi:hypothetical protein